MLLLLLSRFSHVWFCATSEMAAHQAPPSVGFSSKNTGVGCHFLLQCIKVKSESDVAQSCPTLSDPMGCSPPAPPSMGFSRQVVVNRKSLLSSFKEVSFKIFLRACSTPQSWMLEIIWDVLRKLPREKYGSIFTSGAPNPYLPLIYFLVPSPIPLF